MSPLKATCNDCGTQMVAEYLEDLGDLMIAHHNQSKEPGSWTSGGCGLFDVMETDNQGKVVEGGEQHALEATMNAVVTPWTKKVIYDPRRKEAR